MWNWNRPEAAREGSRCRRQAGDGHPGHRRHARRVRPPYAFPTDTLTVSNVEPKQERLLAVVHAKRKLVGTTTVKADDINAVVKLGEGRA